MKRDKFTCKLCGDSETTLNVHHIEYSFGMAWEVKNTKLMTLCEHCHKDIELIKKKYNDIDYKKIKIYKSNNWVDQSRIMFISINDKLIMRIYDSENNYINGYNFSSQWELSEIRKLISLTIKNM